MSSSVSRGRIKSKTPSTLNTDKSLVPNAGSSNQFEGWNAMWNQSRPPVWTVVDVGSNKRLPSMSLSYSEFDYLAMEKDDYDDEDRLADDKITVTEQNWMELGTRPPYSMLTYGARGEPELIRLLFVLSGNFIVEKPVLEEDLEEVLNNTPYHSLPVIIRGNSTWGNRDAIVRMFARKFDLMGQTNHEHLVVEAVFERLCVLKRIHATVIQTLSVEIKNKDKLEWVIHQLRYVILPPAMAEWEKVILASRGPFVVACGITLADLAIMDFLDQCTTRIPLDDLLSDFEALTDHFMLMKDNPAIATYLDERPELSWVSQ